MSVVEPILTWADQLDAVADSAHQQTWAVFDWIGQRSALPGLYRHETSLTAKLAGQNVCSSSQRLLLQLSRCVSGQAQGQSPCKCMLLNLPIRRARSYDRPQMGYFVTCRVCENIPIVLCGNKVDVKNRQVRAALCHPLSRRFCKHTSFHVL